MAREVRPHLGALLVTLAGCGSDPLPAAASAPGCPDTRRLGDTCVGVPAETSCADASWTDGVDCQSVVEITDAGELPAASGSAGAGTCITLAPGHYPSTDLPAGVALLGRGAGCVFIDGISMASGVGSLVRGVTLTGGGAQITGAGAARIEATRIENSATEGVVALDGAAVTIESSEITGSGSFGLRLSGLGNTTLRRSIVEDSRGPGAWIECSADPEVQGCACTAKPEVVIDTAIARRNEIVGILLDGVSATFDAVEALEQVESDSFAPGHGVLIQECSQVTATDLHIRDNEGYGLLVDDSDATLATGLEVQRNRIGIAIQTLADRAIEIDGSDISDNGGVGLLIAPDASRLRITNSVIAKTRLMQRPVLVGGVAAGSYDSGDGILWCHGARVELDGIELSANARASLIIEGPVETRAPSPT